MTICNGIFSWTLSPKNNTAAAANHSNVVYFSVRSVDTSSSSRRESKTKTLTTVYPYSRIDWVRESEEPILTSQAALLEQLVIFIMIQIFPL